MNMKVLKDSLGELWIWDGERVYMVKAEIESLQALLEGDATMLDNGYPADTLLKAKSWLD